MDNIKEFFMDDEMEKCINDIFSDDTEENVDIDQNIKYKIKNITQNLLRNNELENNTDQKQEMLVKDLPSENERPSRSEFSKENREERLSGISSDNKPSKKISKSVSSINEVMDLKNGLLSSYKFINIGGNALYVYYNGYFHLLHGGNIGIVVNELLAENGSKVTMKSNEYRELLLQLRMDHELLVDYEECQTNEDAITFENGTYYVMDNEFENSSTWENFAFAKIQGNYNQFAPEPSNRFSEEFIQRFCGYDPDKEDYLWELIGYLLSNYSRKIIVVFYGPGNTGKSTLASFISMLCGQENCVSMDVNEMTQPFGIAELQGKQLCVDSEMSATVLNSKDVRTIKRVCGNDLVQGNIKYERQFYFVPTAKLLWCTNNKLRVGTSENLMPLYKRLRFFELSNSISEEDMIHNLDDILYEDREYFLFQAMQGLHRLVENNFIFSYSQSSEDFVERSFDNYELNDLEEFVCDYCVLEEGATVAITELYSAYCQYINEMQYVSKTKKMFSILLKKYFGIRSGRNKDFRYYIGIRLKDTE